MLTIAFNSMLQTIAAYHTYILTYVHICVYIIAVAAIHKFVTLTHMSRLTDWCLPLFFFFFFFFLRQKF